MPRTPSSPVSTLPKKKKAPKKPMSPRTAQLIGSEAAVGPARIPEHAVLERHPELEHRGVAPEVLVGEEEHPLAALECPLQRPLRVARRADRPAVASGEGLDVGGGIHVRDGDGRVGEAGGGVAGTPDDIEQRLQGLREAGAPERAPVRWHHLHTLRSRMAELPPAVAAQLESTLARALTACEQALDHTPAAPRTANPAPSRHAALTELNAQLRQRHERTARDAALAGDAIDPSELASLRRFRASWSRIAAEEQVATARETEIAERQKRIELIEASEFSDPEFDFGKWANPDRIVVGKRTRLEAINVDVRCDPVVLGHGLG